MLETRYTVAVADAVAVVDAVAVAAAWAVAVVDAVAVAVALNEDILKMLVSSCFYFPIRFILITEGPKLIICSKLVM